MKFATACTAALAAAGALFAPAAEAGSPPTRRGRGRGFDFGTSLRTIIEQRNYEIIKNNSEIIGLGSDTDAQLAWAESRYAVDYVQHNPDIPNGRQALIDAFIINRPDIVYEYGLIVAEGDIAAVHIRVEGFAPVPLVGMDVFKIIDGIIVEHWDVLQVEMADDMFYSGAVPSAPSSDEESNRRLVVDAFERLFGQLDKTVLDEGVFSEDFKNHNPNAEDGLDFYRGLIDDLIAGAYGNFSYEIGHAASYGNFVYLHARAGAQVAVDIFRVEDGIIVEHWDILQDEVAAKDTASGNPMWPIF